MLYSFDVFDTVITRKTATPCGIFALMKDKLRKRAGKSGLAGHVIENFYEMRIHSEELMRKSFSFQGVEEVTLRDIYAAMAVSGCLDEGQISDLCALEEETELENAVGIPENIQRIEALLKRGNRVVLVSDMYLSQEAIRAMLRKAAPALGELPLYVSSEYGKRKTTGNLYRQVRELENVPFEEWTHVGDNRHQDLGMPVEVVKGAPSRADTHLLFQGGPGELSAPVDRACVYAELFGKPSHGGDDVPGAARANEGV